MGLGLLILVSVGKENIYLSAQPEITFFKIAYKRHTNYSIEPTPQYFKTTPDFGRKCTVNIAKNADLMGQTYLYIELPDVIKENFTSDTSSLKKFAWVEKIGLALINYIEIEIGGTIIDRHYGDWLNIWNEMTISMGHRKSYDKMIGNIKELYEYSDNKPTHNLYIPLSFWFCQDTGLCLPLIALSHHDIKIHVDFNNIESCYKLSPSYYIDVTNNFCILEPSEQFYQIYQNDKIIGEFIYFDQLNQKIYYNPIKGKFIVPNNDQDTKLKLISEKTKFEIFIKSNTIVVEDEDYFKFIKPSFIKSYLLVNYVYLDNFERYNFLNNSHEYLIPVIQTIPEQLISSINSIYKIPFINPIKFIAWRSILKSNIEAKNIFNYSTNPFTSDKDYLIKNNSLLINSIKRMELDSNHYYTNIPIYQLKLMNKQFGVYYYSFGLNPTELQPSGSMNFSKIDDSYLQFKMNPIVNYQNPVIVRCYGIQYNLFRVSNGIGGLGFSI